MSTGGRWLDRDAGPVARPYTLTGGRTRPTGQQFDLIDVVATVSLQPPDTFMPGPGHMQILSTCRQPIAVADLASDIGLPLGVVRVLLDDLRQHGMINVLGPATSKRPTADEALLRKVLDGLHAL
jgi:Protein of unknown function (DUF742)